MTKKIIYPPTYFYSSAALMIILHFLFPMLIIIESPLNYTGIILIISGFFISSWGSNHFKKIQTTILPFEESSKLTTSGLYKYSRNPMYLGMVLFLIGLFILLGSISNFLIIVCFILFIDRKFISTEERMLEEKFQKDYLNYKKLVRKWI